MSSGIAIGHPNRSSLWGTIVTSVGLATVAALTYTFGTASPALVHFFYVPVLAGAFFFGAPGGVVVGLGAGILAGPIASLLPVAFAAPTTIDWIVWTTCFTGVGFATGRITHELNARHRDMHVLTEDTIRALVHTIHVIDGATALHSQKVADHAVAIAHELKLPLERVEHVRRAALLHDVGKLAIPKEILHKPGPLNPEEWDIIRKHPVESERIVERVANLQALLPAVRHHHERIDGRGYPDGVKGCALSLEARIITVADAFDAMTSPRAYRQALTEEQAVEQLLQNAGSQFDPVVVDAFLRARNISYTADQLASAMPSM